VFKLFPAPSGTESILHNFAGAPTVDGANPAAGLVADSAGNLYGTTPADGGSGNGGTIFEIPSNGNPAIVLATFPMFSGGGVKPLADLAITSTGALYGTTEEGGIRGTGCGVNGCGTVFELGPPNPKGFLAGVRPYRQLDQFKGGTDGDAPQGGLATAPNGVLYGTTAFGGPADMGTVFGLTPTAAGTTWTETVLHSFKQSDGAVPFGDLVIGPNGALFGTTLAGGSANRGTVFELSPSGATWTLTVLHSFTGAGDDGAEPNGLVVDSAGNIWGSTEAGGTSGNGTVFGVAP
jgi:uncharacterized repeat protein (TIGR03803 family)